LDRWLPPAASSYAGDIDGLLVSITVIVGAWFIVAEALLLFFALRFRRREGRRAAYLPGDRLRVMSFVLVPCAVILCFDLFIDAAAGPVWTAIKETSPEPELRVRIQGEQWAWRFTYPGPDGEFGTEDDRETVNELHVPLDSVVGFELAAKDVLHSLWIPALRLKQDAVPGRSIRGWFIPTAPGRYEIICAEICGFGHTLMKGALVVEDREAFQTWLDARSAPPGPELQRS
jgi:cytochrome c oxidase subunit 2